MLKYFNWDEASFLIHDLADFVDFKNLFDELGKAQNIRIANTLDTLPKSVTCVDPVEYEALLEDIINTKCRPLILL